VSVIEPLLKTKTFTGLTDASGNVSFSYRINARKSGLGDYTISVTATKEGYLTGNAEGTFTVN